MQEVNISLGKSRESKSWKNTTMQWSDFVDRLKSSVRTNETLREFLQASKDEQLQIKDVGGYVGGYLRGGKRSATSVIDRTVLTLDVDFAETNFFDTLTLLFDGAAFVHATHKHSPTEPRYRLLMPLSRACTPDEYVAVARRIAGDIGIEMFDNTTFEPNRLMFWPSHPKDVEFYWREQRGAAVDVDLTLSRYKDWKDTSLWPTADKHIRAIGEAAKKQENPHEKTGIVGSFCRTYSIRDAIAQFLSEVYTEGTDGRYTYAQGSTAGGLVVYDDTFAYSHHGTDAASGKLCNAFDLVRIHLFGHHDDNERSKKSFNMMERLATEDKEVRMLIAREHFSEAQEQIEVDYDENDLTWMAELETNTRGEYLCTGANLNRIFSSDKFFKEAFKQNAFDGKRYIMHSMPWREIAEPEPMRDVDYSGVRNYLDCLYGLASAQQKINDALVLAAYKHTFHPVKDYLESLQWDGVPRIESVLQRYFGAEDTPYTRAAFRLWVAGAVARIYQPGCKFDSVLVLVDPEQGSAKSTFFNTLGRQWSSDTFLGVHGRESFEQLQGCWIMEIAELAGLRKADVESVRHFISKQKDTFRAAYGMVPETHPRQCVFGGTTNTKDFLRDPSGDRRSLPIDVVRANRTASVFKDLPLEVDQIWAEAVHNYRAGEALYFSAEIEAMAKQVQRQHRETDERAGIVERYLDRKLPDNWAKLELFERRQFLESEAEGTTERKYVCIAEIWCECLGKSKEDMNRYNTREINDLMKTLSGWSANLSTKNFNIYGKQRYYERVEN